MSSCVILTVIFGVKRPEILSVIWHDVREPQDRASSNWVDVPARTRGGAGQTREAEALGAGFADRVCSGERDQLSAEPRKQLGHHEVPGRRCACRSDRDDAAGERGPNRRGAAVTSPGPSPPQRYEAAGCHGTAAVAGERLPRHSRPRASRTLSNRNPETPTASRPAGLVRLRRLRPVAAGSPSGHWQRRRRPQYDPSACGRPRR
jgi:hypothetical protein